MSDSINIGILGLGVVGGGTVRVLTEHADAIARKVGVPLVIKKIAVRDMTSRVMSPWTRPCSRTTPNDVIDDPDIHILCELIGGVEPAYDYVLRAIKTGKNIVTANKEMMAKAGSDLLKRPRIAISTSALKAASAAASPSSSP